jgi:2C-methyl-D-erythritol 2,4-cyclodiphosphate synthase
MAEIKDLNKKSETIFDLARRFPNKTYRELERYKDADRLEEAQQIPLSESQQSQEELEPIEKGVCVTGALRKDRQEINPKRKALEEALANALAINESHQKLNGTLQERLTEVEEDNKKMAHQIEDKINRMRRSGL